MASPNGDHLTGPRRQVEPSSSSRDWRLLLAHGAASVAVGLGVNALSTDVGYRGPGVLFAVAGVLFTAVWIRRLPPSAPLVTFTTRGGIILAIGACVLAMSGPDDWRPYAVLAAALATVAVTLIPLDSERALTTLNGVAAIGLGVALIGVGTAFLLHQHILAAVAGIGVGVAGIGVGVAYLLHQQILLGVAMIGLGTALIGLGVVSSVGLLASVCAWSQSLTQARLQS